MITVFPKKKKKFHHSSIRTIFYGTPTQYPLYYYTLYSTEMENGKWNRNNIAAPYLYQVSVKWNVWQDLFTLNYTLQKKKKKCSLKNYTTLNTWGMF